jgi:carbamoyltransferase
MIFWGINTLNHGSSLSVVRDGNFDFFKSSSTDDILNNLELSSNDMPDKIFWYERPWIKKARQLYAGQYKTAIDMSVLPDRYLSKHGLENIPVTYTAHHASHAAAGYYTSKFDDCAIVVLDAIGEFECATIWHGNNNNIRKVWSRRYPHSLGLFYSAFTQLIGLRPIEQEYLLQQMSDQGDPMRYYYDVLTYMDTLVNARKNMHRGIQDWPHPINNLGDQCDIAAAVQTIFTEQVHLVMEKAKELTGSDCLVYMGGCAMNSKANKIVVEPKFKYIWSLPNPGDASSSLGAILYHTKHRIQWDSRG